MDAAFLRRQADLYMARAEAYERLVKLAQLPDKSVIIFERRLSKNAIEIATYAGIVIEAPDSREPQYAGRKWYVTHAGRFELGPFTDNKFIEWLTEGGVSEVHVANGSVPLSEYPTTDNEKE